MPRRDVSLEAGLAIALTLTVAGPLSAQREQGWAVRESLENPDVPLYNSAKQKLLDGGQLFTYTIATPDPELYCEVAPHYDYIFLEMQHSTLSWADVEEMIAACPRVGIPMVRLPDVLEGSIQKATDIGALGVIGPTINTVEQAMALASFARFPPEGVRSAGRNQAGRIWGVEGVSYRRTINDNMLVVAQIETPVAVESAYRIARVPGIDVLWASNGDPPEFQRPVDGFARVARDVRQGEGRGPPGRQVRGLDQRELRPDRSQRTSRRRGLALLLRWPFAGRVPAEEAMSYRLAMSAALAQL